MGNKVVLEKRSEGIAVILLNRPEAAKRCWNVAMTGKSVL